MKQRVGLACLDCKWGFYKNIGMSIRPTLHDLVLKYNYTKWMTIYSLPFCLILCIYSCGLCNYDPMVTTHWDTCSSYNWQCAC